jgi:hypothetical protein
MPIAYRKNELEQKMLLNLHKRKWSAGLSLCCWDLHDSTNGKVMKVFLHFSLCLCMGLGDGGDNGGFI